MGIGFGSGAFFFDVGRAADLESIIAPLSAGISNNRECTVISSFSAAEIQITVYIHLIKAFALIIGVEVME